MEVLLIAAVLPVIILCYYIYSRDVNKEPSALLIKIFSFGFFSSIPVIIIELILSRFFPTEKTTNFIILFINFFISVALVEEGFKWIITKKLGYDNKEFDEIYDIIVYAVFASLGFACIENIIYIFSEGLEIAIPRALLSVPGHMYFAVIMGYFFSKAKVNSINGNDDLKTKSMLLSILIPVLGHTLYDALLFYASSINSFNVLLLFFIFHIVMVLICIRTVGNVSKIQQNLYNTIETGIITNNNGYIQYSQPVSELIPITTINYCPICGNKVQDYNYCPYCGFHMK